MSKESVFDKNMLIKELTNEKAVYVWSLRSNMDNEEILKIPTLEFFMTGSTNINITNANYVSKNIKEETIHKDNMFGPLIIKTNTITNCGSNIYIKYITQEKFLDFKNKCIEVEFQCIKNNAADDFSGNTQTYPTNKIKVKLLLDTPLFEIENYLGHMGSPYSICINLMKDGENVILSPDNIFDLKFNDVYDEDDKIIDYTIDYDY